AHSSDGRVSDELVLADLNGTAIRRPLRACRVEPVDEFFLLRLRRDDGFHLGAIRSRVGPAAREGERDTGYVGRRTSWQARRRGRLGRRRGVGLRLARSCGNRYREAQALIDLAETYR